MAGNESSLEAEGSGGGGGGRVSAVHASPSSAAVDISEAEPHSSSLLDRSAEYINQHLRAFRAIPWVVGGVGALLVFRYSGLVSLFSSSFSTNPPSQSPSSCIPLRLVHEVPSYLRRSPAAANRE